MYYFINPAVCAMCGSCAEQCPAEAIALMDVGFDDHYRINVKKCLMCGGCAAQCPTGAIALAEEAVYDAEAEAELMELAEDALESAVIYKIDSERCLSCGECAEQCQHGAIYMDEDSRYVISDVRCLGCGACAQQCPAEAIVRE